MSTTAIPLRLAMATNDTGTTFAAKNSTETKPSGTGVFDLQELGLATANHAPSYVKIIPFGENADNETFDLRLYGWDVCPAAEPLIDADLWVPTLLAQVNVVLGARTASDIGTNHFWADTLTLEKGAADGAFSSIISPANDTVASILIHLRGATLIEFDFDADAGISASAGANCMWAPVD